jgi:glutamate dehydrogenase
MNNTEFIPQTQLNIIAKKAKAPAKNLEAIYALIWQKGIFTAERILSEIEWFFTELGLHPYYFEKTSVEDMHRHIESLIMAKAISKHNPENFTIDLRTETQTGFLYILDDSQHQSVWLEKKLEKKYNCFRLESYRSKNAAFKKMFLRLYFITPYADDFINTDKGDWTFKEASSKFMAEIKEEATRERYSRIWEITKNSMVPYAEFSEKPDTDEIRFIIAVDLSVAKKIISMTSNMFLYHGIHTARKYFEPFRNGTAIFVSYIDKNLIHDSSVLQTIKNSVSGLTIFPNQQMVGLFSSRQLDVNESLYTLAGIEFVHQFITSFNEDFQSIAATLKEHPEAKSKVQKMRRALIKDTYTTARIGSVVVEFKEIIKKLYGQFAARFHPENKSANFELLEKEIVTAIDEWVETPIEKDILGMFLNFNRAILKTNFYKQQKLALSFRLDPNFINAINYPTAPFGLFYIYGKKFHGFHIRFRDIARGGIRLISSNGAENYEYNVDNLFDENYSLALTQQLKNKDIPEGGSKGTILLRLENQKDGELAFKKYIDALLDLLIPSTEVVDLYQKEEIIFLGPDEGTAGLMDWAAKRARERGYFFWQSFTTGKPLSSGGIPHDVYGMTTQGVHQYVLELLNQLKIDEKTIRKFQTGGPDGDLGSNEIKISQDKTIAMVDGSGVLYDPLGIDRPSLLKLAEARKTVEHFPIEKLSTDGFFVSINDKNRQVSENLFVKNGIEFRNKFHLSSLAKCDLFVPCGGRPRSITMGNYRELLSADGQPNFNFVVEGANLFFSQDARLELEKRGVIIIKDSSANKGGVTSSSFEVLVSLALSEEEYCNWMIVEGVSGTPSPFRQNYIEEILEKIRENARLEFNLLWREHERTGLPYCTLSDMLSQKINALKDTILKSSLSEDAPLFTKMVGEHFPKILVDKVGLSTLFSRVPPMYLKATFAASLASRYIYGCGLNASEIDFISFVRRAEKSSI